MRRSLQTGFLNLAMVNVANDNVDLSGYSAECLITSSLVTELFGTKVRVPSDDEAARMLAAKVILCPHNEDTFVVNNEVVQLIDGEEHVYESVDVNNEVVQLIDGEEHVYESVDVVDSEDGEDVHNFPPEFLYTLTPTGLPPHVLRLRKGTIVMLLRNINIQKGLCNGTRMVIHELKSHVLRCRVLTQQAQGEQQDVLIPRITLSSDNAEIPFKLCRRQFPVRIAFAMTINKAQGQTFDRVGLLLRQPVFSHGQLYVAFSRVRSLDSILLKIEHGEATTVTKNIVYREIL